MNMRMDTRNLKFILYARKSSESDEKQVQSIDDQLKYLKSLAVEKGLKISDIICEKKSAKDPQKRPGFMEMIEKIQAGKGNAILCWKYDRLTRNPMEGGHIRWLLQKEIIKLIWTNDRIYRPEDNVLLLSIEDGMSNQYIRDLSINVKRGMKSKREKGQFPHRAPMGYKNGERDGERVIVKDPDRFELIQKMWQMILSERYTISDIEKIARDKWKFRTRKTLKMGGAVLSKSRLYELFENPFYMGIYAKDGVEYKMSHAPMVTEEEWDRVQYLIGKKQKPRTKKHDFAFRGPIFCGECGCLVTAEKKTKITIGTGNVKKYTYYHCTKRKKNVQCSQNKSIREDELQNQILEEVKRITIRPIFREWAIEHLRGSHKNEVDQRKEIFKDLEIKYKDIERRLSRLTDMKLDEQLDDQEYKTKKQELLGKKKAIKKQIDSYDRRVDNWLELTERAFNFLAFARNSFINGTTTDKRVILQTLGANITLLDGKILIETADWLIPVIDKYPALQRQYEMLEPEKVHHNEGAKRVLEGIRTEWLGREDSNPYYTVQSRMSYL
jgi:site-specific DNA recombinase